MVEEVSEEELDRLETARYRKDLLAAVAKLVPNNGALADVVKGQTLIQAQLAQILQKDVTINIEPLVKEMMQTRKLLEALLLKKPQSFRIERSKVGFIERIVPE